MKIEYFDTSSMHWPIINALQSKYPKLTDAQIWSLYLIERPMILGNNNEIRRNYDKKILQNATKTGC